MSLRDVFYHRHILDLYDTLTSKGANEFQAYFLTDATLKFCQYYVKKEDKIIEFTTKYDPVVVVNLFLDSISKYENRFQAIVKRHLSNRFKSVSIGQPGKLGQFNLMISILIDADKSNYQDNNPYWMLKKAYTINDIELYISQFDLENANGKVWGLLLAYIDNIFCLNKSAKTAKARKEAICNLLEINIEKLKASSYLGRSPEASDFETLKIWHDQFKSQIIK